MLIRELFLIEKGLTGAELKKYDGKYLKTLIDLATAKADLEVVPEKTGVYGTVVKMTAGSLEMLKNVLETGLDSLPDTIDVYPNGDTKASPVRMALSALFKSSAYTGRDGEKGKDYNAGHLTELFMGLCVSARFFNVGKPINVQQVMDMIGHMNSGLTGKVYEFSTTRIISYPDSGSKNDTLRFSAKIPAGSAQSFIRQYKEGKFEADLRAVLASAVRYCNESEAVTGACEKVHKDKNNNQIDILSDGTGDATSTKADLTLKVDGQKVNLLSLKTFSTSTLGQMSGLKFETLQRFFNTAFGVDIAPYASDFDETLPKEKLVKNLISLYDNVIYPQIKTLLDKQTPGQEAAVVNQIARAANLFARGEGMEDVEIVKLNDKLESGDYKIMRFSDSLKDAIKHYDLEAKLVGGGANGRTIQIWVKPAEGEKVVRNSHMLCQFRSQLQGGYMRNNFETGKILEVLTEVGKVDPSKPQNRQMALTKTSQNRELK
jgi:hypothetical protein